MMKLKNKVVKKRSAASELHNKYKWFVDVLDSFKVYILWMLLQCRATWLYNTSSEVNKKRKVLYIDYFLCLTYYSRVQNMMEVIEVVVRKHLNTEVVPTAWKHICCYVLMSISLDLCLKCGACWFLKISFGNWTYWMKCMVTFWSTIRVHAFANRWVIKTDNLHRQIWRKTQMHKEQWCM